MRRRFLRRLPRAVLVAGAIVSAPLFFACASHSSDTSTAAEPHDRQVIDSTEIVGHGFANTYVAVNSLRPEWFRTQMGQPSQRPAPAVNSRFPTAAQVAAATNSSSVLGVFLDGSKQALGINYLNSLPVEQVAWMRRLAPSEAMSMYGPEWGSGAIIVRLRQ